jgi:hypothetical protein
MAGGAELSNDILGGPSGDGETNALAVGGDRRVHAYHLARHI